MLVSSSRNSRNNVLKKLYKQLHKKIRLLQNKGKEPYLSLYKVLGFYPDNVELYQNALMHASSVSGDGQQWVSSNERLEFLGDGILDGVVADILYKLYPDKREGFMTNARSKIVQRETMNQMAIQLGLHRMLNISVKGMSSFRNDVYGNALEALIGAIYLDQGYEVCYRFIQDVMIRKCIDLEEFLRKSENYKSYLIEWGQRRHIPVTFKLLESSFDDMHNPLFQSAVCISGEQVSVGKGYSKKESQQAAAKEALARLKKDAQLRRRINALVRQQRDQTSHPSDFPA